MTQTLKLYCSIMFQTKVIGKRYGSGIL